MTAEVAIANASAVALAADSAVTIGDQKIYNSALKLFALSKVAPVGVMIYGNADLMDVPWEILIKSFRARLAGRSYATLEEYAADFLNYLSDKPEIFPEESQRRWVAGNVRAYYTLIRDEFFEEVHPILKDKGEIDAASVVDVLTRVVNEHHANLKKEKFAADLDADFEKQVRAKYIEFFKEARENVFENVRLSSALSTKLYDIGAFLHSRQIFSTGVSGLVVAGYGDAEIYPSIAAFDVEGVVENRLKYRRNKDKSHAIRSGNECRIVAFAQDDMVATFMNGVNPHVLMFIQSYLAQIFERLPELLSAGDDAKRRLRSQASKLLNGFFEQFGEHIRDEHAHPVLRMVTVLPKDELAAMAESLVNLTAFKRRITESMETVGGPIDVAVISKGDGLVWVKRKHYFPAELNQHFFANYFRGVNNDESA